jgi:hypothetical protein
MELDQAVMVAVQERQQEELARVQELEVRALNRTDFVVEA